MRRKIIFDKTVSNMMQIIGHKEHDPILLTAIITFCIDLFETDEMMKNEE